MAWRVVAVSAGSPAVTGTPVFEAVQPVATDAQWQWDQVFQAPALAVSQTEETLPLISRRRAGGIAYRVNVSPMASVTLEIITGEESSGSTPTAFEELAGGRLENDWALILPRLQEHSRPKRPWFSHTTSCSISALDPTVGLLGPRQGGKAEATAVPAGPGAVGAGRDTHPGLLAVDDLRHWLTLTIADVARITGISESTIYWWVDHPTSIPRPAKIDRLLGLHALVGGMIDDLGRTITDRWFRAGKPSRFERLREDPKALADIEKEGYDLLMHRARRRLAAAGPARPVTDEDDRRDLARIAEQERDFDEPLKVEVLDPRRLEPDDLQ
jgi:hypothetical protein